MTSPRTSNVPATTPEGLHAALEDAFRRGDLDAYIALHEADATVVPPPERRAVRGLDAIRSAVAPIVSLRPQLTSTVLGKVEGDDIALTHARWELVGSGPDGAPFEMRGRGTVVSRRQADGTWLIVLDDAVTPE